MTPLEKLASLPFHRGTDTDDFEPMPFDCAYAVLVWDARNRIAFNKLIEAEPDKPHDSPDGLLHYVPNPPSTSKA